MVLSTLQESAEDGKVNSMLTEDPYQYTMRLSCGGDSVVIACDLFRAILRLLIPFR